VRAPKDGKKEVPLNMRISKAMHDELQAMSDETGAPVAEIVRRAIRKWIDDLREKKKPDE